MWFTERETKREHTKQQCQKMLYNKAICSEALQSIWKSRHSVYKAKLFCCCIILEASPWSSAYPNRALGLGSKWLLDGWASVTELAAGSASTSEPWGNLSVKICLWIEENWHNTKVRLLERVMVMEPVDSTILSQEGARKKNGGKQLSHQQNYFNVAEVMFLSPVLFSR